MTSPTSKPVSIEQQFYRTWDPVAGCTTKEYDFLVTWPDGSESRYATIPNEWNAIERATYLAQVEERKAAHEASLSQMQREHDEGFVGETPVGRAA